MRKVDSDQGSNLSGHLLIAHPGLKDPNFHRTVVLISAHSSEDGSLGVILNRPMNKTLGEIHGDFAYGPLADVRLFRGGAVSEEEVILTAWHWESSSQVFRLYFGIDEDKAAELRMVNPETELRAFLGYAGWDEGQLEEELSQKAWVSTQIEWEMGVSGEGERFWKQALSRTSPELAFLAELPEDPTLN